MDAEIKNNSDARHFLDGNLVAVFAARGIVLDEVARETSPAAVAARQ
jgi:hypothetical protein